MKRVVSFWSFWALGGIATAASAQTEPAQVNVERRAHDYELVEIVAAADFTAADREILSEFLLEKRAATERVRSGACPELLDGTISIAEFAVRLDLGIAAMHEEIEKGYWRMRDRLSWTGKATLQDALQKLPLWSADTHAVAVVAIAPAAAEASFTDLCHAALGSQGPDL